MKRGANDMLNTFKHYVSMLLDVLAACLMPLIPMLIAASMFKTLAAILGPDMLNKQQSRITLDKMREEKLLELVKRGRKSYYIRVA